MAKGRCPRHAEETLFSCSKEICTADFKGSRSRKENEVEEQKGGMSSEEKREENQNGGAAQTETMAAVRSGYRHGA